MTQFSEIMICANRNCYQILRVPTDKGNLVVTCPRCRSAFKYPLRVSCNFPEAQAMDLTNLLKRRKYRNPDNLNLALLKYFSHDHYIFVFNGEITNRATSTLAYRLIQFKANYIKILNTCMQAVFPNVRKDSENGHMSNLKKVLELQRQCILSRYKLLSEYLDCPPQKTAHRFITTMENWKGYKTYGDYESLLAMYLAPFCNKSGFLECLDYLSEYIDRNPRYGLSMTIKTKLEGYFDELETYINNNLQV